MQGRPALSAWGEAIVAAATGDAALMEALLAGKHDDGRGVELHARAQVSRGVRGGVL